MNPGYDERHNAYILRGLEIAAAGGHGILLTGTGRAEKERLAYQMTYMLPIPDKETDEQLSPNTPSHSALTSDQRLENKPPFCLLNRSALPFGFVDNKIRITPSDVVKAHHGVLFLYDLPQFDRQSLEILVDSLKQHTVALNQTTHIDSVPAQFLLVTTIHQFLEAVPEDIAKLDSEATRAFSIVQNYIDVHIEIEDAQILYADAENRQELFGSIRARVIASRRRQAKRYRRTQPALNADITLADVHLCCISEAAQNLVQACAQQLQLSVREAQKTLRLARTIADLEDEAEVSPVHVAEAIRYRLPATLRSTSFDFSSTI